MHSKKKNENRPPFPLGSMAQATQNCNWSLQNSIFTEIKKEKRVIENV
jgi:hypothetical protein